MIESNRNPQFAMPRLTDAQLIHDYRGTTATYDQLTIDAGIGTKSNSFTDLKLRLILTGHAA